MMNTCEFISEKRTVTDVNYVTNSIDFCKCNRYYENESAVRRDVHLTTIIIEKTSKKLDGVVLKL